MKKKNRTNNADSFPFEAPARDPDGSYTGTRDPLSGGVDAENLTPVQDADDL